jgi:hypothetical protein
MKNAYFILVGLFCYALTQAQSNTHALAAGQEFPQLIFSGPEGSRNETEIHAGKEIILEVVFVDWSDKPVAAGTNNFDSLWSKITSNGELLNAFKRMGATVHTNLIRSWKRMPQTFETYFPANQGWNWQQYTVDGAALLPVKPYPANTIAVVVPNEGIKGFTCPSGAHSASYNGIRRMITLAPDVYKEHYTTLMHEIGHCYGSDELYPASAPYLHEVAGYDAMGDIVYATGFLGYHRYRYGWMTTDRMKLLNKTGNYTIHLKKLSSSTGVSMIVIPDKTKPQKLWIIEIGQDVVSRNQFKAGRGEKMNAEGDRLIIYTVENPEQANKRAIRLVPSNSFYSKQGDIKWLDNASFVAGQSFTSADLPFTLHVNAKSPTGFYITVNIRHDLPLTVYAQNILSDNKRYYLTPLEDGNIAIYDAIDNSLVWDAKTKLFPHQPSTNSVVVLKNGSIQLLDKDDCSVLAQLIVGSAAHARFAVSDNGNLQILDANDSVQWQAK